MHDVPLNSILINFKLETLEVIADGYDDKTSKYFEIAMKFQQVQNIQFDKFNLVSLDTEITNLDVQEIDEMFSAHFTFLYLDDNSRTFDLLFNFQSVLINYPEEKIPHFQ